LNSGIIRMSVPGTIRTFVHVQGSSCVFLDLYPDDLLDRDDFPIAEGATWWALYTRPRHEKQLMRRLLPLSIPFCSPLVPKRFRSTGGRIRTSYEPLFPGYVFIHGDNVARYNAMTTSCVSRWLPVPDGATLVHDLRHIRRLIETGAPLTAESRLAPGVPVRIRSGPFLGIEGVVLRREGQTRLLVAVNFLQKGASVLLDQCEVERLF
jgi:transcriptional antiterminator RfaH